LNSDYNILAVGKVSRNFKGLARGKRH